jgi:hypothetical protein
MIRFDCNGSGGANQIRASTDRRKGGRDWRRLAALLPIFLFGACANGDFDRVKPELVADDVHAWLGTEVVHETGGQFSTFPLTDDERTMRDLGFPLIEPPFDRHRWYSIIDEYGIRRFVDPDWLRFFPDGYQIRLMATPFRSANARYSKLNEDIRNDVLRIGPFFEAARRVVDMDNKRAKSLEYVGGLTPREYNSAVTRNAENALVIAWVQCSLSQRAAGYQYALEHLVVSTPSSASVDVERSITLMQTRIAENHLLDEPNLCTGLPLGLGAQIVSKQ